MLLEPLDTFSNITNLASCLSPIVLKLNGVGLFPRAQMEHLMEQRCGARSGGGYAWREEISERVSDVKGVDDLLCVDCFHTDVCRPVSRSRAPQPDAAWPIAA